MAAIQFAMNKLNICHKMSKEEIEMVSQHNMIYSTKPQEFMNNCDLIFWVKLVRITLDKTQ